MLRRRSAIYVLCPLARVGIGVRHLQPVFRPIWVLVASDQEASPSQPSPTRDQSVVVWGRTGDAPDDSEPVDYVVWAEGDGYTVVFAERARPTRFWGRSCRAVRPGGSGHQPSGPQT